MSRPHLKRSLSVNDKEYKKLPCNENTGNESANGDTQEEATNQNLAINEQVHLTPGIPLQDQSTGLRRCCTKKKLAVLVGLLSVIIIIESSLLVVRNKDSIKKFNHAGSLYNKKDENIVNVQKMCLLHSDIGPYIMKDRCKIGSSFVGSICPNSGSKHKCKECQEGQYLPNSCFCAIGLICQGRRTLQKQPCSWCKKNCPCLNKGSCYCPNQHKFETGEDVKCDCPPGFKGKYCEIVPARVCEFGSNDSNLENCEDSTREKCFIFDPYIKTNLTCIFVKGLKPDIILPNCSTIIEKPVI